MLKKMKGESEVSLLLMIGSVLISMSAWLTHISTCLSDERWGFLIAGALCFPVAVVHGVGIWFGAW